MDVLLKMILMVDNGVQQRSTAIWTTLEVLESGAIVDHHVPNQSKVIIYFLDSQSVATPLRNRGINTTHRAGPSF